MKKRILSLFLTAVMLISIVPAGAFAQEAVQPDSVTAGDVLPEELTETIIEEPEEEPEGSTTDEPEPTDAPAEEPAGEPAEEPEQEPEPEETGEASEEQDGEAQEDEEIELLSDETAAVIGTVRVVVENNTLPVSAGAAWEGVLVDAQTELYADSTMMTCVVDALGEYPQEGADSGYIESINGLGISGMSGWMGTLNDWFTSEGFAAFNAADGTLQSGDEIRIMYSCNGGEDCGGSWNNNDKTLAALSFGEGELSPAFDAGTHEYTLTVPYGTTVLYVTPTAANKNFQVHTFVGDIAYKRSQPVPTADGTVISIVDGDPSWPSMNGGSYGTADSVPAEVYYVTVVYEVPVTTADVTVRSQMAGGYLHGFGETLTVSSDKAESFGYADSVEGVSALDALAAAHELVFGDDFTADTASAFLAVTDKGYVTTIFGTETSANGFFVNGGFPNDGTPSSYGGYNGTTVTTQQIFGGDVLDFFVYADTEFYSDYYTYAAVPQRIYAGRDFTVTVSGGMAMGGYMYADATAFAAAAEPLEGAQLALVDALSGEVSVISGTYTDENGKAVVTAPAEGTYLLTALGNEDEELYCFMNPTAVTVGSGDLLQGPVVIRTSNSTADLSNAILAGENEQGIAVFDGTVYEYALGDILTDANSQLRFYFDLAGDDLTAKLSWLDASGAEKSKDITKTSARFANCLHPGQNTLTLTIGAGGETYDTYTFRVGCKPTLTALSAAADGTPLYTDGAFAPDRFDYVLTVPESAERLTVGAAAKSADYTVLINGGSAAEVYPIGDSVEITLQCADGTQSVYTLAVNRVRQLDLIIVPSPADAVVRVYDAAGVEVPQNADGSYSGMFGEYEYIYTVTKYGYIAEKGNVPAQGGKLDVILQTAPETDIGDVGADWGNFRGSDDNMGITDTELPTTGDDTELIWAKKLGSGWKDAPSVQIIADNSLIVMSGKKLYKLDLATGEITAEGDMVSEPSYGYTPPTYAAGMIFCPLGGGTVQAFNASTLESLWVYTDVLGGQALSPITYSDGYIYTGFWKNYTDAASYVCLSVTDEDPADPLEVKQASWRFVNAGGYYWAGSLTIGNAVIFGSEDGTKSVGGNAHLYSIDKISGALISDVELAGVGDIRSTIAYDPDSGRIFFTTADGYLCSAFVDAAAGVIADVKMVYYNAKSTSTPVVYKGRVYFGTGSGITTSGSSGNFVAADAVTLKMINYIGLRGYPQCSALLSTAYESEGYLYFYCTYNSKPGGISMIRVDAQSAMMELTELYNAEGYEQFCITSLICDKDGTIYYKNDSGNIMAVGFSGAARVRRLIDAIGEVTADSADKIAAANEAYGKLTEAEKEKVTNYPVLEAANAEYGLILADIAAVEEKIDNIGTVTVESEAVIADARSSYELLTDSEKTKVNNIDKLIAAEGAYDEIIAKIQHVEEIISMIGKVTADSADKIAAANEAYGKLTEAEKEKVTNYPVLEAAIKAYEQLQGDIAAAELAINSIGEVTADSEAAIKNARSMYDELSESEKSKVSNYSKLTEAEAAYAGIAAAIEDVEKKISAIGTVDRNSGEKIIAARKAYDALPASSKRHVINYPVLEAAESTLSRLEKVVALIGDIGEVTADSEAAIKIARGMYDALSESEKSKVSNYSKLTEAEAAYAGITAAIDAVEKKISAIGTVDRNSGEKIAAARKAYDALPASSKEHVENHHVLEAAEARFSQFEKADKVISLIGAIGTVTAQSGTKITAARNAYNALSEEEKKLVTNYNVLQAAETKYAALKSTTTTSTATKTVTTSATTAKSSAGKTVTVEIDGKKYTVDERAAELMTKISELAKRGNAQESEIVSLYRVYNALPETVKPDVKNYSDLEKLMTKLGEKNHRDSASGVMAAGLEWNIRLKAEEVTGGTEYGYVLGSIGVNTLKKLMRISFIDILTGGAYELTEPVKLSVPAELNGGEIALALYCVDNMTLAETRFSEKDGVLTFDAQSGLYAIVGVVPAEKDTDTVREENVTLPLTWVAAGGAGIAALLAVLIIELLKRKE